MKKNVLFVVCSLILFGVQPLFAQQHTVEMKASLPSAYANIYKMRLADLGPTPQPGDTCKIGEIAMFANLIYKCSVPDQWELFDNVWTENDSTNTVYLKNPGNLPLGLAIGTNQKEFKLTLSNDGGIIAKGTQGEGQDLLTSGAGTRLIWYPKKAAFRAGTVDGAGASAWDDANIGFYSSVTGGIGNMAKGSATFIGGGRFNTADGNVIFGVAPGSSSVVGGFTNQALGPISFIGGGAYNRISGGMSAIGGGGGMTAANGNIVETYADYSFIGGGEKNFIGADPPNATTHNSIGGGFGNKAFGNSSTVGGGFQNQAVGNASTVAGGVNNIANGTRTFVGGGLNNVASQDQAAIAGGANNTVSGQASFIGSGASNQVTMSGASVVGGEQNVAAGQYSFIGGGAFNHANGFSSVVAGGYRNTVTSTGNYSSILGGGNYNSVSGSNSAILGGANSSVEGNYSYAAGENVHVLGDNSFGLGRWMRVLGNNTFAIADYATLSDVVFSNAFVVLSEKTAIGDRNVTPAELPAKLNVWTSVSDPEDIAVYMDDIMQIKQRSNAPACAGEADVGKVYVDSDQKELCFCNGSKWHGLSTGLDCN